MDSSHIVYTLLFLLVVTNLTRMWHLAVRLWTLLSAPRRQEPHLVPILDENNNVRAHVWIYPGDSQAMEVAGSGQSQRRPDRADLPNSVAQDEKHLATASTAPERKAAASGIFHEISPTQWSLWPNSRFQSAFTSSEYKNANELDTNWVWEFLGQSGGGLNATSWKKGRKIRRRCLGIISCANADCGLLLEPSTQAIGRSKQLQLACLTCGGHLQRIPCNVEATVYRWNGGAIYQHSGAHNHLQFTHATERSVNGVVQIRNYEPKYILVPKVETEHSTSDSPWESEEGNEEDELQDDSDTFAMPQASVTAKPPYSAEELREMEDDPEANE